MPKDRLILLLLLSVFALLGADCNALGDDDEKERPLPDRALASSALVRAYYNMRTFPEEMRSIKIPENGSKAEDEDDELTVNFDMGTATVTSMRVHWYIVPPAGKDMDSVELVCRLVAPNGTASSWKTIDTGPANTLNPQLQVDFQFEFDGIDSAGTWKAQVRDYLDDEDGRCLFRNASLHVNRGDSGGGGGSGSDNLDLTEGNYGSIPEAAGNRTPFDVGWFGIGRMLPNNFTIASSFELATAVLSVSVYVPGGVSAEADLAIMLVSPSGNWHAGSFPDTPTFDNDVGNDVSLKTFAISFASLTNGFLMNLAGEPTAGTWTVYIVDINKDGKLAILTNDAAGASNPIPGGGNLNLALSNP